MAVRITCFIDSSSGTTTSVDPTHAMCITYIRLECTTDSFDCFIAIDCIIRRHTTSLHGARPLRASADYRCTQTHNMRSTRALGPDVNSQNRCIEWPGEWLRRAILANESVRNYAAMVATANTNVRSHACVETDLGAAPRAHRCLRWEASG